MGAAQLPTVAFALGAMSCLTTAEAQSVIEVANAETLGKIGRDPSYPLHGHYRQSSDIDGGKLFQSIGNRSHPFTGQYNGQCHTIDNLQRCLVQAMKDGGRVDSLRFTRANINSTETAGVVACEILDNALASNIQVEDAFVATSGEEKFAGIGAGYVSGAVTNMTVVNGTVTTSGAKAHAGISAGRLEGKNSTVTGTGALNCKVLALGKGVEVGIGAGNVIDGTVNHTMAAHSRVEVLNEGAAGIGAGNATIGTVAKTTAAYCHVKVLGGPAYRSGNSGIGVGIVWGAKALDTIAVNCHVEGGRSTNAGIGAGRVRLGTVARVAVVNSKVECLESCGIGVGHFRETSLSNVTAVNSTVTNLNPTAINGGIGVGKLLGGTVTNTTGVGSKILTSEAGSKAGIGAGDSTVSFMSRAIRNTVSVNCEVRTTGSDSAAGFAAGYAFQGTFGVTTALSSRIRGNGSSLGVGVGENPLGRAVVNHVRAIDCTIEDFTGYPSIYWGSDLERCNVLVNGKKVPDTPFGCDHSLDNLCKYAAPGLVDADCKPNNRLLMEIQQALRNIRHSHPLQPDFLNPQQVSQFGVCWTRPPLPTDKVTGANNTVSVNISAPCCLPATAAPLATGLSGVAVTGIALGAVAACALVAGGAYVYHRYNRSDNSEGKEPVSPKDSEPSRLYDTIPT